MAVFDLHARPDVIVPVERRPEGSQTLVGFGGDLVGVPRGGMHGGEDEVGIGVRDGLVEEIAHAVDEHDARPSPSLRLIKPFRSELEVEAVLIRMAGYAAPAFSEGLRVAASAARRYLVTPGDRVPGGVCPFDCA